MDFDHLLPNEKMIIEEAAAAHQVRKEKDDEDPLVIPTLHLLLVVFQDLEVHHQRQGNLCDY